jgi:hypothetical protein
MSRIRWMFPAAALAVVAADPAQSQSPALAVVVKTVMGTPASADIAPEPFFPSQTVRIVQRAGSRVRVRNNSDHHRTWWMPRDAVVAPSAFKRVRAWHGPATFEDDTADYDSGTTYQFRPDGSYTYDYADSNGNPPEHGTGHLSAYGSVFEAAGTYFWVKPDGTLCDADLDGCFEP